MNKKYVAFLDESTHLYKRVCPSVCRSVRPSVTCFFQCLKMRVFNFGRQGEGDGKGSGCCGAWRGVEGLVGGVEGGDEGADASDVWRDQTY